MGWGFTEISIGRQSMFRRVLVANRGEIAVRIIRAIHELGAEAVAVYSDADRTARHVLLADFAVRLGPAPASLSYLDASLVLAAARDTGAEAVHPGYGFLSERGAFAQACLDAGVTFVGPSPATLDATGNKVEARRLAKLAGARLVPGTANPVATVAEAVQVAHDIGFPLLIKAAAGGGGKGMQIVETNDAFASTLASAQRIALAAFGDGSVYLERLVRRPRHIEVQIFGDGAGDVIALGDRDCSVQRRFQKVVEEAPAPGLTDAVRARLASDAIAIGKASNYGGAGTVEFLFEPETHETYFLEVNARLQVEHPVTELVHGVDLVHAQLRFASGTPMREALAQSGWRDPAIHGQPAPLHAIEARIGAEDVANGWAPSAGRIGIVREPAGPGVRVDSACEPGLEVGVHYDSLLSKVIGWGPTREIAIARLRRALDEHVITGIETTLPFHRWILRHQAFLSGDVSTDFVAEHWDPAQSGHEQLSPEVTDAIRMVSSRARANALQSRRPDAAGTTAISNWSQVARREALRRG